MKTKVNWRSCGILLLVFVFTVVWFGFFAALSIDPHHDGIMLKCAADVASGKILFKETFCQYGDLCIRLQALPVRIFGPEVLTIRWLTVLFYGGIAVMLDIIWRRFLSPGGRVLQMLFFWGLAPFYLVPFHPWSSVYALVFMLIALEGMLCYFDCSRTEDVAKPGRFIRLAVAALAAGCAFSMRTPVGVVSWFAAILALAVFEFNRSFSRTGAARWFRSSTFFTALFTVVPLAGWIKIIADGAWKDYLQQCFRFVSGFAAERGGLTGGKAWERISQTMFPLVSSNWILDAFFGILPLAVLIFMLVLAAKRRERQWDDKEVMLLTVILFGLASWHQYYPVPCVRHLYWASIPMYGIYILIAGKLWGANVPGGKKGACRRNFAGSAAALVLISLALPALYLRAGGAWERLVNAGRRVKVSYPPVRGLLLLRGEAEYLDAFMRIYTVLPEELRKRGVFNCTEDGLFPLLLPEAPGWKHPMFVNWKNAVYPDYLPLAAGFVQKNRPVVLSDEKYPALPGYRPVFEVALRGKSTFILLPQE